MLYVVQVFNSQYHTVLHVLLKAIRSTGPEVICKHHQMKSTPHPNKQIPINTRKSYIYLRPLLSLDLFTVVCPGFSLTMKLMRTEPFSLLSSYVSARHLENPSKDLQACLSLIRFFLLCSFDYWLGSPGSMTFGVGSCILHSYPPGSWLFQCVSQPPVSLSNQERVLKPVRSPRISLQGGLSPHRNI